MTATSPSEYPGYTEKQLEEGRIRLAFLQKRKDMIKVYRRKP